MKSKKRISCWFMLVMLVTVFLFPALETEAGRTDLLLDGSTLTGANWNNPQKDVVVKEGTLVFPNKSSKYTRFITRAKIQKMEGSKQLAEMSASMKFNNLPAGQKFILAFGLSGVEALQGQPGNVEIAFANRGGITMGITAYNKEGKAATVLAPKACGMSLRNAATVKVEIGTDKTMRISVNGTQIYAGSIQNSGEGNFGFLQSGSCGVEISNLQLTHYRYDRPENTNVNETFDNGEMDTSVLTALMNGTTDLVGASQKIQEYKGNHVMMFRNTGNAYIATKYQYSNFKLNFDVPYLVSEATESKDGNTPLKATKRIMVSFGAEQIGTNPKQSPDAIVFGSGYVTSLKYLEQKANIVDKNPFADGGKAFSVEVSVVDGVVSVGIKWIQEKQYQKVLTYKPTGGIPTGYVHIYAIDDANFAVDNLKIENLDKNPNVIQTEFKTSKIEAYDEKYIPTERVYASERPAEENESKPLTEAITEIFTGQSEETIEHEENGSSWYLLTVLTGLVGIVALTTTIIVVNRQKKRKEANEYAE